MGLPSYICICAEDGCLDSISSGSILPLKNPAQWEDDDHGGRPYYIRGTLPAPSDRSCTEADAVTSGGHNLHYGRLPALNSGTSACVMPTLWAPDLSSWSVFVDVSNDVADLDAGW